MAGLIFPAPTRAASSDEETGARLLQAQLPPGLSVRQADCVHLSRALRVATLAHHQAAPAILSAALSAKASHGGREADAPWDCACVTQLFRTAVNAAPDHASDLLDTAEALCPDCTDALTAALQRLTDNAGSSRGAGNAGGPGSPGGPGDSAGPAVAGDSAESGDPNSPGYQGLAQREAQGLAPAALGTADAAGDASTVGNFGVGLGAGFPGAPGFSGSSASGGLALPTPTGTPVTSAVNN